MAMVVGQYCRLWGHRSHDGGRGVVDEGELRWALSGWASALRVMGGNSGRSSDGGGGGRFCTALDQILGCCCTATSLCT